MNEVVKPRTLTDVFADYESQFHSAIFENSSEEETNFDLICARQSLVSEGLSMVKTIDDCDRILSHLSSSDEALLKQVKSKRNSLQFQEILGDFDKQHQTIMSTTDDEMLQQIRCDRLRINYLNEALKLAKTQQDCLDIFGRTLPRHTSLRENISIKMASFPIQTRCF